MAMGVMASSTSSISLLRRLFRRKRPGDLFIAAAPVAAWW
jgi:hypothetical protein